MIKNKKLYLVCVFICILFLLTGCSNNIGEGTETLDSEQSQTETVQAETTSYESAALNTTDVQTTIQTSSVPMIEVPDGQSALYSYTQKTWSNFYYATNDASIFAENDNLIPLAVYLCETENASISGSAGELLLIHDAKWLFFNCRTGETTDVIVKTDAEYTDIRLACDTATNEITGYILQNSEGKNAFYNVETETLYGDFTFNNVDTFTSGDYYIAYKLSSDVSVHGNYEENDSYVYHISDGSLAGIVEKTNLDFIEAQGDIYFYANHNPSCGGNITIYTESLKRISDGDFSVVSVTDDGSIITLPIIEGDNYSTTYEIYSPDGTLEYKSREYDRVLFVCSFPELGEEVLSKGAAVVVDEGRMKLVGRDGGVIQTYCDWQDNYSFHYLISSYIAGEELTEYASSEYYLKYRVITNPGEEVPIYEERQMLQKKPAALYMIVEDNSDGTAYDYYYSPHDGSAGVFDMAYVGGYSKPVLYLYPETETDLTVSFAHPERLTVTYPEYSDNGWSVHAFSDGTLYDNDGREHYALYWEEDGFVPVDFSVGFYVEADDAVEFLEEKLDRIGLSEREANEFIMYWLPIMKRNGGSLVYFELTESREEYNALRISPAPDSLLRVAMHIKKADSPVKMREQYLPRFERSGFTAIEWGGVIY